MVNNNCNIPTGGFPPIYKCQDIRPKRNQSRSRKYITKKTYVPMSRILAVNENNKPFIDINK